MNVHAQSSRSVLIPLVLFHLIIIALSNYLVQIPVTIFGFQTTWGAFTFPLIFLATDLTVRVYGAVQARRIIFTVMLPALVISYVLSVLFYEARFQGFAQLAELNTFVARIAIASFIAYTIGQLLDVTIFNKLRNTKNWWIAPASSSVIGGLIDTVLFFSIAFYQSTDEFMAANWQEIATVDYVFKLIISVALFVPAYGLLMNRFAKKINHI
ncbi:MAG: 7-cyano-7-deazaguanine/7-aminomethyl-7-deazaguanine transporter [Cocleimonas sp.]|nr:7-cyano-7-deazaguanine/7-aminomethyl-7-deazaguanine transporter [Cocleimonas sp.]